MKLLISFTDKSHSFTNGVEFGRILAKMEMQQPVVDNVGFPIHASNKDVLKEACEVYGYIPSFSKVTCDGPDGEPLKNEITGIEEGFDEWLNFIAKKQLFSNN